MKRIRRVLVFAVLAFWQGGFTFYAAVVVPVAQSEIGHVQQGFITRRVTDYLNLSGAVTLAVLAWDVAVCGDRSVLRRRLRWSAWLGMVVALLLLCWLHVRLDELMKPEARLIFDGAGFTPYHRAYLWVSTVQWALAVLFLWLLLRGWQEEDRGA